MAIEVEFVEDASLPIPNEDISATLVVHVIRSFVTWLKSLVLFDGMMVIKLYFSLFCLMPKHFINTLILLYVGTNQRQEKRKERATQPQFPSTQEKRHPPPPQVQHLTQSQSESVGNVSCPLSLRYLLRAVDPWINMLQRRIR